VERPQLAVAKILENMEIGHNVLHGQWVWSGDPVRRSRPRYPPLI
jgi:hypothetical protein